jgi:hypothetical protein
VKLTPKVKKPFRIDRRLDPGQRCLQSGQRPGGIEQAFYPDWFRGPQFRQNAHIALADGLLQATKGLSNVLVRFSPTSIYCIHFCLQVMNNG